MIKKIFLTLIILCGILGFFLIATLKTYDFSMRSALSENTSLRDFKGKKLIVYFGYTFCPDICPATLSLLGSELKNLNKAHLLFVSLDPQRDSNITKTDEWLRYFYPHSNSLLAKSEIDLVNMAKNYGVIYQKIDLKDSFMQYSIAHSNNLYFIDERGKFWGETSDLNPQELRRVLKEFLKH